MFLKAFSVHRSSREHHINKVVWETLNRCWFGDERLAWDGKDSKNDVFYTLPKSPVKKDSRYSIVVNSNQTQLEVHGYVHYEIVKQLLELDFGPSQRSPRIEQCQ